MKPALLNSNVMSTVIKLAVNCVFVAVITIGGVLAFVALPEFTLKPMHWATDQFGHTAGVVAYFLQSFFWWVLIGGVIAFVMLFLKPRRVLLYGLVSVAAFILFGQFWSLDTQVIWYVREVILAATIPLLYWLFVHMGGKRYNKTSKGDAVNGAA